LSCNGSDRSANGSESRNENEIQNKIQHNRQNTGVEIHSLTISCGENRADKKVAVDKRYRPDKDSEYASASFIFIFPLLVSGLSTH